MEELLKELLDELLDGALTTLEFLCTDLDDTKSFALPFILTAGFTDIEAVGPLELCNNFSWVSCKHIKGKHGLIRPKSTRQMPAIENAYSFGSQERFPTFQTQKNTTKPLCMGIMRNSTST